MHNPFHSEKPSDEGLDSGIGGVEEVNNAGDQDHIDYGQQLGINTDDTYTPFTDYENQTPYEHLEGNYEEVTDWIAASETNVIAGDPGVSIGYSANEPDRMLGFAIRQILEREKIPGRRKVGNRYFRTQSITLSPGGGASGETSTRIARDDGRRSVMRLWASTQASNDIWISNEKITLKTISLVRPGNVVSLKDVNGTLTLEGEGDVYVGNPAASTTDVILNVVIEYT